MGKPGPREIALREAREAQLKDMRKLSKAVPNPVAADAEMGNITEPTPPAEIPANTSESKSMPKAKRKKTVGNNKKENGHSNRSSKTAKVGAMLLRKEGCTNKEVLKATGWPSVSMPAQAKMVGLKLRKEKTEDGLRYYGVK